MIFCAGETRELYGQHLLSQWLLICLLAKCTNRSFFLFSIFLSRTKPVLLSNISEILNET